MGSHATGCSDDAISMLGLPSFVVLAAGEVCGELELVVETTTSVTGCRTCGVVATAHGRRTHLVRDVPRGSTPVMLLWRKRIWRCDEPTCPARTWSETDPQIAARAVLSTRARAWATQQVGRDGRTVAVIARILGVGWATVMRAVVEHGTPPLGDPDRLAGVSALGVDEHAWLRANATRRTAYVTGIVDITAGRTARLLDVVPGRSGTVYAGWIAEREQAWRDQITVAALDPFRGYAAALRAQLPDTVRVLDAFHVVKLANTAVDEVRRRVQQDTLGRRGHRDDPLYRTRRLLTRGQGTLSPRSRAKLTAALAAGDPRGEVEVAWQCAQHVHDVYHADTPQQGRQRAHWVIDTLPTCPIPEIARLGKTLRQWRSEFLAYHDTDGASNGPTEATNLIIEKIRRNAHGFRNWHNYRLRLLLHCGIDYTSELTPPIRTRQPRFVA